MTHHHNHSHLGADYNRAFALGIALNAGFIAAEIAFGVVAGSLALLADAGHNFSDVLGLALAWGANALSRRQPTSRRTYGWKSSTIMAALLNGTFLMVAIGGIVMESIRRFSTPALVSGRVVIIVAGIGVLINTLTALLFVSGRKSDLNIRGAFLHMASDAGVSGGVVLAGFGIAATGWYWLDSVMGLLIAVIIFWGTWGLFKDSLNLALHAVPRGIDTQAVAEYLAALPGIEAVHDLHIWSMSTTEVALTAHLVRPRPDNNDVLLLQARDALRNQFGIAHVTLQLEQSDMRTQCGADCGSDLKRNTPV